MKWFKWFSKRGSQMRVLEKMLFRGLKITIRQVMIIKKMIPVGLLMIVSHILLNARQIVDKVDLKECAVLTTYIIWPDGRQNISINLQTGRPITRKQIEQYPQGKGLFNVKWPYSQMIFPVNPWSRSHERPIWLSAMQSAGLNNLQLICKKENPRVFSYISEISAHFGEENFKL